MDSPRQHKKGNPNREAKCNQNQPSPPKENAYDRLLSQHNCSTYSLHVEEFPNHYSSQRGGHGSNSVLQSHGAMPNIQQQKVDQVTDFSDSSDFSPSSMKNKGEESSLSLYTEKLNACSSQQEVERKQDVSERQQRGPRWDTTSQDGDIESGEELEVSRPNSAKKHQKQQRKIEGSYRNVASNEAEAFVGFSQSPVKASASVQEEEKMKSKKKAQQKHPKDEKRHPQTLRPKPSDIKDKTPKPCTASQANSRVGKSKNKGNKKLKKQPFEAYMTSEEVSRGLKRGELYQGRLRINRKKYTDAFIPSPDDTYDIYLEGVAARNRALDGDVVVVQVLPPEQWKVVGSDTDSEGTSEPELQTGHTLSATLKKKQYSPKASVNVDAHSSEMDEVTSRPQNLSLSVASVETGELSEPSTSRAHRENLQKTAKVVYIVEKKHSRAVTGSLKFLPDKPFALFSPVDHQVPRINVPLTDCPADFSYLPSNYSNTLFICRITGWSEYSCFAEGRLDKTLGEAGEIEPETEGILMSCGVDFSDFSANVLECLPKNLPFNIPPEEIRKRKDLRKECVFTIDPASARDLDDALSCKRLPDGNFEVGVHIADVSYFVEENNALDAVASKRATSVYLVQKMIPMLPHRLCEDLCSLNPLSDKLTISVIWTLSPEGKVLDQWFGRSVIRSCVKLSYDHAQNLIDAPEKVFCAEELPPVDQFHSIGEIHQAVLDLHAIAKNLRAHRFSQGGALRLDQMKLSFTLDKETMMPQGCYIYQHRDSNKLVEEFMLLANMSIAKHIYSKFPDLALLRRHPPPNAKTAQKTQKRCKELGFNVDFTSAETLQTSLNTVYVDDEYHAARRSVLIHMCCKPMKNALYFCSGISKDEVFYKHYALNVPFYTHFTSPIRRYADIIVHRLLASSLGCGPPFSRSPDEVNKQAARCNEKNLNSKRVSKLSSELFFGVFVKECGPLNSKAMVMGVLDMSFDVLVLQYGVQKRVYLKFITDLVTFHHHKMGKKSELKLVWTPENPDDPPVEQIISVFSLVEVQLQLKTESCLEYSAVLKRPDNSSS